MIQVCRSMKTFVIFLLILLLFVDLTLGVKILFFFGMSTYSHKIATWSLVEKLSERGHELTFLSPFPPKTPNPNVTELFPKELVDYMSGTNMDNMIERRFQNTHQEIWHEFRERGVKVCEAVFSNAETREFLVKKAAFDLVIIDALHNECAMALAYKYQAPFILFGTSSVFSWQADTYGFFPETSWIPDLHKNYPLKMSFFQKVVSTLSPLYWYFVRHWSDFYRLDKILKDGLEMSDLPPMKELEKNVSLVLYNNHFTTDFPRSLPPLYVSIGGIHAQNMGEINYTQHLSNDLHAFLDESENGFIYISFGTSVQISMTENDFQEIFFNVLKRFRRVRFVWKWEMGLRPAKMPSNVFTLPWAPQQAILMHPNIKGFITNGGLFSIQEAIFAKVPLLVLPVFAEQDYNAEKVKRQGYGIRLEIVGLEEFQLRNAIDSLLNEPQYKRRIVEVSRLFKDRPMKPLQTAVWWVEYIIRNKGGQFLRPLSTTQTWFERRVLDVWAFIFSVLLLFLSLILFLVYQILLFAFNNDQHEQNISQKPRKFDNAQNITNTITNSNYEKTKLITQISIKKAKRS